MARQIPVLLSPGCHVNWCYFDNGLFYWHGRRAYHGATIARRRNLEPEARYFSIPKEGIPLARQGRVNGAFRELGFHDSPLGFHV